MDLNSNEPTKNNDDLNAPPSPPQVYSSEVEQCGEKLPPSPPQAPKKSKKSIAVKISLGLLAIVLVLAGYIGFRMYKRMKEMKEVFNYIQEMSNYAAPTDLPIPRRKLVSSVKSNANSSRLFNGAGFIDYSNESGEMPDSLMSADDTRALMENARKIDQEKIMNALNKYAERSIVKEIMNDLKKDPNFQKALEGRNSHNPLEVMANIKKVKNMNEIMGKYAMRPDFMKLMLDVMRDAELKPLFKMIPNSMMPNLADSDIKSMEAEMKKQSQSGK